MQDMRAIMKVATERKAKLTEHPFYEWVRNSDVALEDRLTFAPILANFVMNFRDMNLWFIRFEEAPDQFKAIINGNTQEDETHSSLFVEDWQKLRLDDRLGWTASDTLWWLFLAEETEPFRAYAIDFAQMTVADGGDPLLRFAHSEAGEACGNAFFDVVSKVATALQRRTGVDYRYFGEYHLNRERGHVIASEGIFDSQPLGKAQAQKGVKLANAMFDIFFGMHDRFLEYAQRYVAHGVTPKRERYDPPRLRPNPAPLTQPAQRITGLHAEVQAVLDARRERTAAHPFYLWLRQDDGITPRQKLQRFIPMWVMDIMGYRDLNRYALRFRAPADDKQRAFNLWADALETHSALFMNDWDALGMDDILGWNSSETLKFLFLDPDTDVHRRNIASFIKLALAHPKPALRFWMLEALEASGEAFFANTKVLALAAELEQGQRMDYLGDRHYLAHPGGNAGWTYPFKEESLDERERDIAIKMVHTVFNAVDEQLLLSLTVATTNKFGIAPERRRSRSRSRPEHRRSYEAHP